MDRPGGNATGVVTDAFGLLARRLDLLRDLLPQAAIMGVLINPTSLTPERFKTFMLAVTLNLEQPTLVFSASSMGEIDEKLATAARRDVEALLVLPDPMFHREHKQIVELAANYQIPTSYPSREYAQAGGLMSYEYNQTELSRQAGVYTGRILNGEPPSILPVLQSTKIEFVINLKTAATLGITVPPTIMANADELIE
jgi:putative ABC transport system substrate-binding protein